MTKLIPILSGRCLVVELPEGAISPEIHSRSLTFDTQEVDEWGYDYQAVKLPEGNWRIIGMLSEVSEGEAEQVVGFGDADPSGDRFVVGHRLFDKEQEEPFLFWRDVTALESLDSAILAEGWYFENPHGEEPTHLEHMRAGWLDNPITDDVRRVWNWKEAQSRVIDRGRCLLLGRDS